MFEKFSQRTRQVVFLARFKAGQRGAGAIGVEDFLVSLVIEDQGKFQQAVSGVWTDDTPLVQPKSFSQNPFLASEIADELLPRLEAVSAHSQSLPTSTEMPLSQASKKALSRAESLCDQMQDTVIEPLHLLAAILENRKNKAAQVLRDAGITSERVINSMYKGSTPLPSEETGTAVVSGPASAEGRAKLVLTLAKLKAWMRGAVTVRAEDFLAALVIEDQGSIGRDFPEVRRYPEIVAELRSKRHTPFLEPDIAKDLLTTMEAIRTKTREQASREKPTVCVGIASSRPLPPYALVPISDTVHSALIASAGIQDGLGQAETLPLHVLAAIVEDQSCTTAQTFRDAGITREKIAAFLKRKHHYA